MRAGALGIAVVAVAAAVAVRWAAGDDEGPARPPEILEGYRIVYRVEVFVDGRQVNRREITIRRPFDGTDEVYERGQAEPASGSVAVGGRLFLRQNDRVLDLGERLPQSAPGDIRLAALLPDAERLGLVRRQPGGDTEVLDRPCRVWRFGAPLGDPLKAPSADEYADLCFDQDGLVLSEEWHFSGSLLRRTTAVEVETRPPAPGALAAPAEAEPSPGARGVLEALPTDRVPETDTAYWVATDPPWDLSLSGRSRATTADLSTGLPTVQDVAFGDTYLLGPHFAVVEHRVRDRTGEPDDGLERVDGGRIGVGQLRLTPQGPELEFRPEGWVVTVRGNVPVDHLIHLARELRPVAQG